METGIIVLLVLLNILFTLCIFGIAIKITDNQKRLKAYVKKRNKSLKKLIKELYKKQIELPEDIKTRLREIQIINENTLEWMQEIDPMIRKDIPESWKK